ncbi:MAG: hypothetical protein KDJ38_16940 [Gammaproteobacteria bacterium]|nr:hypothetical protein [Gammaproteobacteria bacterium]
MPIYNRLIMLGVGLGCLSLGTGCATNPDPSAASGDTGSPVLATIDSGDCQPEQGYFDGLEVKPLTAQCLDTGNAAGYLESWKNGLLAGRLNNESYILKAIKIRREARQHLEENVDVERSRRLLDNMNKRIRVLQARNKTVDDWLMHYELTPPADVQTALVRQSTD